MSFPRRAALPALLILAAAALAPALAAAQSAPEKQQSPNGKIIFQSTQGSDGFVNDIYVVEADGKRQTRRPTTRATTCPRSGRRRATVPPSSPTAAAPPTRFI